MHRGGFIPALSVFFYHYFLCIFGREGGGGGGLSLDLFIYFLAYWSVSKNQLKKKSQQFYCKATGGWASCSTCAFCTRFVSNLSLVRDTRLLRCYYDRRSCGLIFFMHGHKPCLFALLIPSSLGQQEIIFLEKARTYMETRGGGAEREGYTYMYVYTPSPSLRFCCLSGRVISIVTSGECKPRLGQSKKSWRV